MIGVQDRSVKIPGGLGVQEKRVPLIYLMIAAVAVSERLHPVFFCALLVMVVRRALGYS